jgi:hypothetical protein
LALSIADLSRAVALHIFSRTSMFICIFASVAISAVNKLRTPIKPSCMSVVFWNHTNLLHTSITPCKLPCRGEDALIPFGA